MENPQKIDIPLIDVRNSSPVETLRQHKDKIQHLVKVLKGGWITGLIKSAMFAVSDRFARRWLKKNNNPYRDEIEQCAKIFGQAGLTALNLSYETGCTTSVCNRDGATVLARVMDWPFPELGENLVVAHQRGKAGEFYNVTWPGLAAVFNGVAPGRFAAAINQAPMRRGKTNVVIDWARELLHLKKKTGLPPGHLLRQVFENASTYDEAKKLLMETPVAAPVIYTLAGTKAGEACVIERLEDRAIVREMRDDRVCTANHFESSFNGVGDGWLPRGVDSYGRMEAAKKMTAADIDEDFKWFKPPLANERSRVALVANAAKGTLSVVGLAGERIVTNIFKV